MSFLNSAETHQTRGEGIPPGHGSYSHQPPHAAVQQQEEGANKRSAVDDLHDSPRKRRKQGEDHVGEDPNKAGGGQNMNFHLSPLLNRRNHEAPPQTARTQIYASAAYPGAPDHPGAHPQNGEGTVQDHLHAHLAPHSAVHPQVQHQTVTHQAVLGPLGVPGQLTSAPLGSYSHETGNEASQLAAAHGHPHAGHPHAGHPHAGHHAGHHPATHHAGHPHAQIAAHHAAPHAQGLSPGGYGSQVVDVTGVDDSSPKGDDTPSSARKFGRVTGAKGYSLQEIQVLFALIHEKPPVDNSEWVSLAIKYNVWAKENKKSLRTGRGLKDKLRKLARVPKDEKHKPLTLLQQEARDCFKLINASSNVMNVDPDKEETPDSQRVPEATPELRLQVDHSVPLMHEITGMIRVLVGEARQVDQRLHIIEQMLESVKGGEFEESQGKEN
mmetsp:Transcript_8345/g.11217  ORF Transcript_8345/g.11217 Transcript_8345/m.11217 type:complete len:439 (+) Transcript_8345:95-1411(+)